MSHSDICHQIVSQWITSHVSHPEESFCREYWSCETFDQIQRQPFYQEMLLIILSFLVWGGGGNFANSDGDWNLSLGDIIEWLGDVSNGWGLGTRVGPSGFSWTSLRYPLKSIKKRQNI